MMMMMMLMDSLAAALIQVEVWFERTPCGWEAPEVIIVGESSCYATATAIATTAPLRLWRC